MQASKMITCGLAAAVVLTLQPPVHAAPLGTSFTYQGQLKQEGVPLNDTADFRFSLHDAENGGVLLTGQVAADNVDVVNGLFTVPTLDFGQEVFGEAAWLEIEVRTPAWDGIGIEPPFTILSPRQAITAAPFALQMRGMFVNDAGDIGIGTQTPSASLDVTNTGGQTAIRAKSSWIGVFGSHNSTSGTFPGVWGETDSRSNNATALRGIVTSTTPGSNSAGVLGKNNGTGSNGIGVKGVHDGDGTGVRGEVAGANGFAGLFEGGRTRVSNASGGTLELFSPQFPTLGSNFTMGSVDFVDGTNTVKASVAARHTFFGDRLEFSMAGQQRVHIDGLGRMGVGTTLNAAQFHVFRSDADDSLDTMRIDTDVPGIFGGVSSIVIKEGEIDSEGGPFVGFTIPLSLNFNSDGNVLLVNGGGNVGIGTATDPDTRLHVDGGTDVKLGSGGFVVIGNPNGLNVAIDNNEIMARNNGATATLFLNHEGGTVRVPVLQITGADLAEKFPVSEEMEPGAVVEIDPDNPGKLRVSRGAYNRRVAGIVSGAGGLSLGAVLGNLPESENAPPIALAGRVYVSADTTNGPIQLGDLLTTSKTPGRAMKVTDYARAQGAIIGKAMTRLPEGHGLILVLVSLQ